MSEDSHTAHFSRIRSFADLICRCTETSNKGFIHENPQGGAKAIRNTFRVCVCVCNAGSRSSDIKTFSDS